MKPGLLMLPSAVSDSRVHNILPNKIDTDFQFSRASSATRVNHQGLIENVGYFSSELIQNGNFSELGSELITNGDFATNSDWNLGAGWSINNGKAVAENTTTTCNQDTSFTSGKTYKVVFTVSDYKSGTVRAQFTGGGATNGTNRTANGTYTEYIVASASLTRFRLQGLGGGFTGKIDNVSVKEVDPDDDWVINGEWEYVDNGISITNATGTYNDSALYQLITLDSSKQYKATIDVSSISGSLQVYTGSFSPGFTVNTTGVKSFILDLTSVGGRVNLLPSNGSDVVVKSFSLVEVIGDKPRLDYEPLNPTCPHLLLEPQSTNRFLYSEDLTQYNLSSTGTNSSNPIITSNYAISPDGTRNADRVQFNAGTDSSGNSRITETFTIFGTTETISVYLKSNDGQEHTIDIIQSNQPQDTVTVTSEWQRFSFTRVNSSPDKYGIGLTGSNAETADILAWGFQLEQQSYSTSYIPTAGAAETRVGELLTKGGNENTFNNAQGVLYAEIAALADDLTFRSIAINDGTDQNSIILRFRTTSNKINALIRDGGSAVNNIQADATIIEFNKFAFAYESGNCKVYVNGNQASTIGSSAFTLPELFELDFSKGNSTNTDTFYGKVKGLATYNRKLTDTELYTITSTQYSAYSGMVAALGNYTIPC